MNTITDGVSVIIPFYNSNRFLHEALASVEGQNIKDLEVIICVDHQSEQPKIKNNYILDIRIIQNNEPERGAGVCRFVACCHARHRFLAFLDADDFWLEGRLEKHLDLMMQKDYAFSFAGYKEMRDDLYVSSYIPSGKVSVTNFLRKTFTIGCLTVLIDQTKVRKIHKNNLRRRNDYRMWYDVIMDLNVDMLKWGYLPEVVSVRRLHNENLTRSKLKSIFGTWTFYKSLNLSFYDQVTFFIYNTINTILRKTS